MEVVPFFVLLGVLVGGWRRAGSGVAVAVPTIFWVALWISSNGELYGDGPLDTEFWVFVIVTSAILGLVGVALHQGVRSLLSTRRS